MQITTNETVYPDKPIWLDDEGSKTLKRGYLLPDETPKGMYRRLALAACHYLNRSDLYQDFFEILYNGWLGPATPVACNFGVPLEYHRGLPISCFGLSVGDSIDSIYKHKWEMAQMSKGGGGVGCVSNNTEYLTPNGWKRFDEYQEGDLVAQYNSDLDIIEFVKPLAYIKEPAEKLYHFKSNYGINSIFCESHEHLTFSPKTKELNKKAYSTKDILNIHERNDRGFRNLFKNAVQGVNNKGLNYSNEELRFIVALQADGSLPNYDCSYSCIFRFKKQRKVKRLRILLNSLNLKYTETNTTGYTNFYIWLPEKLKIKQFPTNFYQLSTEQLNCISKEVIYWDGNQQGNRKGSYFTSVKSNADFIQYAFTISNLRSSLSTYKREGKENPEYVVRGTKRIFTSISLDKRSNSNPTINEIDSPDGYKYCFTMPKSTLIIRHEDTITLTRNCYYGRIRHAGSLIKGGGISNGIVPWAREYDLCAANVTQGNCYSEDTEVLTDKGWTLFKNLEPNQKVAQVNRQTRNIEFVLPKEYITQPAPEKMIRVFTPKSNNVDLLVTPNHKMVIERLNSKKQLKGELELISAESIKYHRDNYHYLTFPLANAEIKLTAYERFLIAFQADGRTLPSGNSNGSSSGKVIHDFHLSKQRKVERLEQICYEANIEFKTTFNDDQTTTIYTWLENSPDKSFDWINIESIDLNWCNEFIEELSYWDAYKASENTISYTNTNINAVNKVQQIASLAGYKTTFSNRGKKESHHKDRFEVLINTSSNRINGQSIVKEEVTDYKGLVYCVEVPSNILLVRRNNKVSVCGNTRRGAMAHYLPIEHPDALELLLAKDHLEGDPRQMIDGNIAFTVTDKFMESVLRNEPDAIKVWSKALECNIKTGSPYFIFIDTVNRKNPDAYKLHNLIVETSNLCSEITLFTDEEHSFICCLSSLNLSKWFDWKDWIGKSGKGVIELSIYFLDAVLSEFIERASNIEALYRAVNSAKKGRALGLGVMGLHYLYQKQNLPFKCTPARELNIEIHRIIQEKSSLASMQMAKEYGQPIWCEGTPFRHTHRCVHKDTTILTKKGLEPIKDLVGTEVEIWNGFEWSKVKPFKTKDDDELWEVKLDGGYSLTCTKDHRWFIQNNRFKKEVIKETKDLNIGDKLSKWDLPIINGSERFPFAYTAGFFTGDGSYNKSKPKYANCKQRKEIRLYGVNKDKHQCIGKIEIKEGCNVKTTKDGALRFYIPDEVPEKFEVPSINCTLEDKLNWLAGYFDSDGSKNGQIASVNKECLFKVKNMALSCGLFTRIKSNKDEGLFTLMFRPSELLILNAYTLRVKFEQRKYSKAPRLKVVSIKQVNNGPSYCLTDELKGSCLFNGIRTAQCAIAPTRTNCVITNSVSPGIEPTDNNAYIAKQAKGSFVRKNPLLVELLKSKGIHTPEVIDSIVNRNGSVMHLKELSIDEILIFLTAREIDPYELVRQAADRTDFICQAQSLNRFLHPNIPISKFNDLVFLTWKHGVKSSYYTKSSHEKLIRKVQNEAYLITKPDCNYCDKAKQLMTELGIKYREFNHSDCTYYPWTTVPYIWYQGHAVGTYEDFVEVIKVQNENNNPTKTRIVLSRIDQDEEAENELHECVNCEG